MSNYRCLDCGTIRKVFSIVLPCPVCGSIRAVKLAADESKLKALSERCKQLADFPPKKVKE